MEKEQDEMNFDDRLFFSYGDYWRGRSKITKSCGQTQIAKLMVMLKLKTLGNPFPRADGIGK